MVNLMKSQLIAGIAGVTIVFGATGLSVIAAAEDDPAITACEAGLKSTLTDGMVYRRINAQLTGATVRIDYETKFKKDAAVPGSLTCKFRFIEASDYFLFQFDEAPQECRDLINRGKVEGSHGKMGDLCNRLVEAVDRVKTIQESAVRGLGVYPISAKSTALSKTP